MNKNLKLSQKQHIKIWRETLHGSGNDLINHRYHAKAASLQAKKNRLLTRKEKKAIYNSIRRKK